MRIYLVPIILIASLMLFGCSEEQSDRTEILQARPVTVLELEEREYSRETHLTGSVSLYREERVGFEISGRVLWVLDEGKEVEGPAFDENGQLVRVGEIIAKADETRYRLRLEAFQARLDATRKALEVTRADLKLARQNLERQKKIFQQGAGSQQDLDDAQSKFESIAAREAQRQAEISEIRENLKQAEEDLADCNLLAPFSGRITRIHISQGAVVDAGDPVVTLSLMDPIQVQVAVSAEEDRRILTVDRAVLYPKNPYRDGTVSPQINAIVYDRGAVADQVIDTEQVWDDVRAKITPLQNRFPRGAPPPFVNSDFGDVYEIVLALYQVFLPGKQKIDHSYPPRQLEILAERIEDETELIASVAKVDFWGVQPEQIYVEVDSAD